MQRFSKGERIALTVLFIMASITTVMAGYAYRNSSTWYEGSVLIPEITRIVEEKSSRQADVYVVSYDPERKYLVIRISGFYTQGSDSACQYAGELFHQLCSLGVKLEVRGDFVPSAVNPMTVAWTKVLTDNSSVY
jgi:hypothetical protein